MRLPVAASTPPARPPRTLVPTETMAEPFLWLRRRSQLLQLTFQVALEHPANPGSKDRLAEGQDAVGPAMAVTTLPEGVVEVTPEGTGETGVMVAP